MTFSLQGKTALVTGAARGLGFEIAKGLAEAGAQVILNGRDGRALDEAADLITKAGHPCATLVFDVASPRAVDEAFREIEKAWGRLNILVNNVGQRDRRPLENFTLAEVTDLLETNLAAPLYLAKKAAALMDKGDRIINVTSIAGQIARGDVAYTASKGGLDALTRALSAELGPRGITVNAIAPGYFATRSNEEMVKDRTIKNWLKTRTSLGRWGEPHEIAGAAVFLASPAASYISGQIIAVDGGFTSHY
jgi:gluconate 5-dehydrogenase